MHGINTEFATAVRGMCTDFQNRCAEFRKFPRGFCLALIPTSDQRLLPLSLMYKLVSLAMRCSRVKLSQSHCALYNVASEGRETAQLEFISTRNTGQEFICTWLDSSKQHADST
jgi:hypothetical protein